MKNINEAFKKLLDPKSFILGMQHLLAMYAGSVAVPLVIGKALNFDAEQITYLISIDIFMCGIATLLQLFVNKLTGIGLPIMLGCAFQYVSPIIFIGTNHGLGAVYGSIICAGVFVIVISPFFAAVRKLFPPVATGTVIITIGLTLMQVAAEKLGGGDVKSDDFGDFYSLSLAFGTIIFILLIQFFAKGFIKSIAILLGLVAGTVVNILCGKCDFSVVTNAKTFHLPMPFYFGPPQFEISSIIVICLIALTALIESTGGYFAIGSIVDKEVTQPMLKRGYRSEGIAIILGGLFNTFPYTSFSQNVGLLQLSGIKTRKPIFFSCGLLIILGLLPKVGALAELIPQSVLGGAMLVMFGMVIVQGVRILGQIDFTNGNNLIIVAVSVGLGISVNEFPELFSQCPLVVSTIFSNGIIVASLSAVLLNLIFNGLKGSDTSQKQIDSK